MTISNAFLHSIAYSVGEPKPIREIEPIARDPALLDFLYANGLRDYRCTSLEPAEHATQSIQKTLQLSGLDPRQIDSVVWGSTSFQKRNWYTNDISRCFSQLGLQNVTPIGVTLSECGNLAAALRVSLGLLASGHRYVLLTVTDCCTDSFQRLVPPSVTVLSDGAASCIISADPQGFELLTVHQCTNHRARPIEMNNDSVRLMRYNAEGIRRASRAALDAVGIQNTEVTAMITNNLTQTVIEMFAAQCGVAFERVFLGNVAPYGHVFAADGLINLTTIPAKRGDTFLLVLNGTCNWGAALLRATNASEGCQ